MKIALFIFLAGCAYAFNPAMVTSNTYPASQTVNSERNNNQTAFTPRRPVFRNGMLSPINYTPYVRSAPIMPRDTSEDDEQMRILPYPSQYITQHPYEDNDSVEDHNNQGYNPYLGVLPQGMYPMNN